MASPSFNPGWYDANGDRAYPLEDLSPGTSDAGLQLPADFLVDAELRISSALGRRVYISSAVCTSQVVSVLLAAVNEPEDAEPVQVGVLTLPQPLVPHRAYSVEALVPGFGGWLVFGRFAESLQTQPGAYSWRFSDPRQSLLTPRTVRPFRLPGLESLSKYGHNQKQLTGNVRLQGGADLAIQRECLEVPILPVLPGQECVGGASQTREVITFNLYDSQVSDRNVFNLYKGPCGNRPESGNCDNPQPIEFVSTVTPDCCGNITVVFRGCANLSEVVERTDGDTVEEASGVLVECDIRLDDTCLRQQRLPDRDGRLPSEFDDLCDDSLSESDSPTESESDPVFEWDSASASEVIDEDLPFDDDFDVFNPNYLIAAGTLSRFEAAPGDYRYSSGGEFSSSGRHVRVLNEDHGLLYRQISVDVRLLSGLSGDKHNAAVVANYRVNPLNSRYAYWVAELDWDGLYEGFKSLRVGYYSGSSWFTLASIPFPDMALASVSYRLSLKIWGVPYGPESAWLQAEVFELGNPSNFLETEMVYVAEFAPLSGLFGFGTNRAPSEFSRLQIQNLLTNS